MFAVLYSLQEQAKCECMRYLLGLSLSYHFANSAFVFVCYFAQVLERQSQLLPGAPKQPGEQLKVSWNDANVFKLLVVGRESNLLAAVSIYLDLFSLTV